jgi:aldehyde dehydrogenase (NAD+)
MHTEVASSLESLLAKSFVIQKSKARELKTELSRFRKERLKSLRNWILTNRAAIQEAMYLDFKKHPAEVDAIELFPVLSEIRNALVNLDNWMSPRKVEAPMTMLGTSSFIQCEPRGVCLIISPWNYPFLLCVGPLVSALAAGNAAVLKPSELTPHVSSVIVRMTREVFDPSVVACFEGGASISQQLLKLAFDHIFFTGSPTVGKMVMKAASDNLTSVTLELGGKSPSIITDDANLKDTAERTAVSKFVNNGQTCIAPDYILIDEKIADNFIKELIEQTGKLFGANDKGFDQSPYYCRIVNDHHFLRLSTLLNEAIEQGAKLRFGGTVDRSSRFIHPTILSNVSPSSRLMREEIFGPILPVVTFKSLDEAIAIVNEQPKPLALYVFSESKKVQQRILKETSSGGACINDSGVHFFQYNLPFGGVNNSGIGKSHGYYGFLDFSNQKAVLKQRWGFTTVKAFYPPYTNQSAKILEWLFRLLKRP